MTDSWPKPPSIVESEFKILYAPAGLELPLNALPCQHDCYFHLHMSGIAVFGLTQSHPIIQNKLTVNRIEWNKSNNKMEQVKISGKRKKGAPKFNPDDLLCTIYCENNYVYEIRSLIKCKLIEINTNFLPPPIPEVESKRSQRKKYRQNKMKQDAQSETAAAVAATATTNTAIPSSAAPSVSTSTPPSAPTPPSPPVPLADFTPLLQEPEHRGFLSLLLVGDHQMNQMLRFLLSPQDWLQVLEQRGYDNCGNLLHPSDGQAYPQLCSRARALMEQFPDRFVTVYNDAWVRFKKGHLRVDTTYYNILDRLFTNNETSQSSGIDTQQHDMVEPSNKVMI